MARRSTSPLRRSGAGSTLWRYVALDLGAWVGCLGLGWLVHRATGRIDAMVAAAIVGETAAFYGLALLIDGWTGRSRPGGLARVLGELALEFAPAEVVDCLVVRPTSMLLASAAFDSPWPSLAVGGVAADVVYYGIAMRCRARVNPEGAGPDRERG